MRYPQRLVITRPAGGGVQDPDTGEWVPNPNPVAVYDGAADVQDQGRVLQWQDGRAISTSDAEAYLPRRNAVAAIKTGDHARVHWENGDIQDARVLEIHRLDGAVFLRRVAGGQGG